MDMFESILIPQLDEVNQDWLLQYQQEEALPYFQTQIQGFLNKLFPRWWVGRLVPPRSPDSNPLDFSYSVSL